MMNDLEIMVEEITTVPPARVSNDTILNEIPNENKIFVGGLPWTADRNEVCEFFKGFGEVTHVWISIDSITTRCKGFGFICFKESSTVDQLVDIRHFMLGGKVIEVKRPVYRQLQRIEFAQPTKVFVGGISPEAEADELKEYFGTFGQIVDFILPYDHLNSRHKGFAFITFSSSEAVEAICLKRFHLFKGRTMECKRAIPPKGPNEAKEANEANFHPRRNMAVRFRGRNRMDFSMRQPNYGHYASYNYGSSHINSEAYGGGGTYAPVGTTYPPIIYPSTDHRMMTMNDGYPFPMRGINRYEPYPVRSYKGNTYPSTHLNQPPVSPTHMTAVPAASHNQSAVTHHGSHVPHTFNLPVSSSSTYATYGQNLYTAAAANSSYATASQSTEAENPTTTGLGWTGKFNPYLKYKKFLNK